MCTCFTCKICDWLNSKTLHAALSTTVTNTHTTGTVHTHICLNVKTRKCEGQDEED